MYTFYIPETHLQLYAKVLFNKINKKFNYAARGPNFAHV